VKAVLLVLGMLTSAGLGAEDPPPKVLAGKNVKRTDAQIGELAVLALKLTGPLEQRAALEGLKSHRFRSVKTPEREKVLYAQGILEERLGRTKEAALTFHKLERTWPRSPFLADGQVLLADAALERKKPKEAEERLKRALASDLPVETKRKAQELLLWTLVEHGRPLEGLNILRSLVPLSDRARPSERGLAAMVQVLCAAKDRTQAEGVRKDYQTFYPSGKYLARVDMAWARLLGAVGDSVGSATELQKIIQTFPKAAESDEARLALATLLSEGKLPQEAAANFPPPDKLISELGRVERKSEPARRTMLVKLRLAMGRSAWAEVVNLVAEFRTVHGALEEESTLKDLRAKAVVALAQEALEKDKPAAFLKYLEAESVASLSPDQRLQLLRRFARTGLPEPAQAMLELAPPAEAAALRKAALEELPADIYPQQAAALFQPKGETPLQALRRAQSLAGQQEWTAALRALPHAKPGPERIETLLRCLRRPAGKDESPAARLKEAGSLLARAPEKGADLEPLAVLVADLKAKAGDWKGALALYPESPRPEQAGWVGLMRATCQVRLGQKADAKATLAKASMASDFKAERERLGKELGL
jgi:tetratricopeptide (TPR) repeat protein